jgi:chromate transporter
VAAGLVLASAVKLAPGLLKNPLGRATAALLVLLAVLGVAVLRWPLPAVVLGLGSLGMALAWWRLAKAMP